MKCPICNSKDTLHRIEYEMKVQPVSGVNLVVKLEAFSCSHCEQEVETPQTTISNDLKIAKAKLNWHMAHIHKTHDFGGLLRNLRASNKLTQKKMTSLIGTTKNSVSKYERGEISLSGAGKRLVLLMAIHPEIIPWLSEVEELIVRNTGTTKYSFGAYAPHTAIITGTRIPGHLDILHHLSSISVGAENTEADSEMFWNADYTGSVVTGIKHEAQSLSFEVFDNSHPRSVH